MVAGGRGLRDRATPVRVAESGDVGGVEGGGGAKSEGEGGGEEEE